MEINNDQIVIKRYYINIYTDSFKLLVVLMDTAGDTIGGDIQTMTSRVQSVIFPRNAFIRRSVNCFWKLYKLYDNCL